MPRDLFDRFGGRIGLFHNQPADQLLDAADLVVAIGYDPIEYEPGLWNKGRKRNLIHIDVLPADADQDYRPELELTGDIAATLGLLTPRVERAKPSADGKLLLAIATERAQFAEQAAGMTGVPIHPMRLVHELQKVLSDDMTLCIDMGSFHIWIARYLYSFRARQLLVTNGQQTLGVALPWAIAACLVRPREKVISVSGDGGFLFSAMELETAVRLKCNFVHLVLSDGAYNMVEIQQVAKYGRSSGVKFGPIDVVKYAEAFGAKGFAVDHPDQLAPVLDKALRMAGPVLVSVPLDYRENYKLMEVVHPKALN